MNCFRVQSLLSAYLDQELDPEERRVLRNHLFNCPECNREMRSLSAIKQILGNLYAPDLPGDPLSLVQREISGLDGECPVPYACFNGRHLLMTAACAALFLLTSLALFPQKARGPALATAVRPPARPVSRTETQPVSVLPEQPSNLQEIIRREQMPTILTGTPVSR